MLRSMSNCKSYHLQQLVLGAGKLRGCTGMSSCPARAAMSFVLAGHLQNAADCMLKLSLG